MVQLTMARGAALVAVLAVVQAASAAMELAEPMLVDCGNGLPVELHVVARDVEFGYSDDGTGVTSTAFPFFMRTRACTVSWPRLLCASAPRSPSPACLARASCRRGGRNRTATPQLLPGPHHRHEGE